MTQNQLIGVLGGTYDPVHKGHVYVATALAQYEAFKEIYVVPCYQPVHRNQPHAGAQTRLAMIELVFNNYPKIKVDDREIARQGPSYAYETLLSLTQQYPNNPICWILGSDAFASFHHWHRWQDILNNGHLVIVKRPGSPLPSEGPCHQLLTERRVDNLQALTQKSAGNITVLDINSPYISAHTIRQKLQLNESVKHLVPSKIWRYIQQHKLYATQDK